MRLATSSAAVALTALLAISSVAQQGYGASGSWNTTTTGSWGTASNWSGSTIANGAGSTANFLSNLTTDVTVTLDVNRTIGSLNFQFNTTDGTYNMWRIDGASGSTVLTLSNGASSPVITTTGTYATIDVILAGTSGLTKNGNESLYLTGANTYSGGTTINDGTLIIGNRGTSGNLGSGNIVINSGGQLSLFRSDTYTLANKITGAGTVLASSGTLVLTGTGSSFGQLRSASQVRVSGGATIQTAGGQAYLGGDIVVSGPGTVWTSTGDVNVYSIHPDSRIQVENGGVLNISNSSELSTGYNLGTYDYGNIVVTSTGKLRSYDVWIGKYPTNNGLFATASVDGTGSLLTVTNSLRIGYTNSVLTSGSQLSVTGGGAIVVEGVTKLLNTGRLIVDGGNFTANDFDKSVGAFSFNDGTFTVSNGLFTHETTTGGASNVLAINGNTASADPLFRMTNGATAVGVEALVVGSTGLGQFELSSGSVLTNTAQEIILTAIGGANVFRGAGYLGLAAGSTGTATVSGAGSIWQPQLQLVVGQSGSGTLVVSAGGRVTTSLAYLGAQLSSTGAITVTGANSQLTVTTDLKIGNASKGTLTIGAGGLVTASRALLSSGSAATGTLIVTGAGARLSITRDLIVGEFHGGVLRISAGGQVVSRTGSLSSVSTATSLATITGTGSNWTVTNALYLGGSTTASGGTGLVSVTGGGSLIVGTTLKLWNNGTLTIDGGSVTARNFDRGVGTLAFNDGTLTVSGGIYTQTTGSGTASNILTINGGLSASDPQLQFTNGASAVGVEAMIIGSTGRGELVISGGSTLTNTGANTLLGSVTGSSIFRGNGYLGLSSNATGEVTVSGAGARWSMQHNLYVGASGTGILNVLGAGEVRSNYGHLGDAVGSHGTVVISGSNSLWTITNLLRVGTSGSGVLTVEGAGQARSYQGLLGVEAVGRGAVTISGLGSQWSVTNNLYVGYSGTGNLNVQNGGRMQSAEGFLGLNSGAVGTATISGTGSQWTLTGNLFVGYSGDGNLNVNAGGRVSSDYASVAYGLANGNVVVSGPNSQMTVTHDFNVGGYSGGIGGIGTAAVSDGGTITAGNAYFGLSANSEGDLTVDGTGSLLNVSGTLVFGQNGNSDNSLANGSQLRSGNAFLGVGSGASGSVSLVEGASWTVTNNLTIGSSSGAVGTLDIGSGSKVTVGGMLTVDSNNGYVTVQEGGVLTLGAVTGALSENNFINNGTVQLMSNSSITSFGTIGSVGEVSGRIQKVGGGTYSVAGSINNSGIMEVTSGTLQVIAGGLVEGSSNEIHSQPGSSAAGVVAGAGAWWAGGGLAIWDGGSFKVADGGLAEFEIAFLGFSSGVAGAAKTDVVVAGAGSQFYALSDDITVGYDSGAKFSILDGGYVESYGGNLAAYAGSSAEVLVSGTNSQWVLNDSLIIGGIDGAAGGTATLTIASGGSVVAFGETLIWDTGKIYVNDGGTFVYGGYSGLGAGSSKVVVAAGGHLRRPDDTILRADGYIVLNGTLEGGAEVVGTGQLGGSGVVTGSISGAGLVTPGNSPGILDVAQIDPTSGIDFLFEFTRANQLPDFMNRTAPGNDVLHLTGANPFLAALTSNNVITLNLLETFRTGDILYGGFFTNDSGTDFVDDGTISNATYHLLFQGVELSNEWGIEVSSISMTGVDFGTDYGGTVDGRLMKITITGPPHASVPEPGSMVLAGMAAAGFYARRRKRLRSAAG